MAVTVVGPVLLAVAVVGGGVALAMRLHRRAAEKRDALRRELQHRSEIDQGLRAREASLFAIIENVDAILLILDPEGEFLFCEGRGKSLLGGELTGDIVGRRIQDVFLDRPDVVRLFERCRQGESLNIVTTLLNFSFRMLASPVQDKEGTIESVVAILMDVTGAEEMRRRLAESEFRFRSIFENAPYAVVINRTEDGRLVDANGAFLRIHGISKEELHAFDAASATGVTQEESQEALRRIVGRGGVFNQEVTIRRPDGSAGYAIYSTVPISYGGEPCLLSIVVDVTEQKMAELALRESEEKYRAIFSNAPVGIFQTTFSGDIIDVNPSLVRMFGYAGRQDFLEAMQGRAQMLYAEAGDRARQLDAQMDSPEDIAFETLFKRKDGSTFLAGIKACIHFDAEGNPSVLDGTIEDISERKRFETELQESESRLRTLYRSIPDLVWLKNPDGVFLSCNPAFEKFFGTTEAELVGKTDFDIVSEEMARFFQEHDRRAMAAERSLKNEEWLTSHDGYQGLFETVKTPMRDAAGKIVGVLGVSRDITSRVAAEKEIREWMQRFEIITSAAQQVFYDWDVDADIVLWTGATREVLGYDLEEMRGPVQNWIDMLHPEDAPRLLRNLEGAQKRCGKFEEEYRLRHKDGQYVHVHESGVFLPGDSGRAFRMLGIMQDISARKKAELALAASEKRYRALFESTHVAILILDGERFVECNPGANLLIGRDRFEIIGKTPAEFSPRLQPNGESSLVMMRRILAQVADGMPQAFDWVLERPDGTQVWTDVSLTSMDLGEQRYLIALVHDVTERRKAELLLKQSEEKFSKVFALAPYSILIIRAADNVVLDVNDAYQAVTGYSREEILGRKTTDYLKWVDQDQRQALLSRLVQDGVVQDFEASLYKKNGATRCVLLSGLQVDIGGELCRIIIVRDITELKLAQQNMIQSEKMMSVGGLAAGMAHEINNPLSIVLQSVRGMQRRLDPSFPANQDEARSLGVDLDAVHTYLERRNILAYMDGIADAGQRAAEIMHNMLNFSRKSDTSVVECSLATLVQQAVTLAGQDFDLKKNYDFRKIAVSLEADDGFPPVRCVPTEIEQVLLNLLRNAAQAMAQAKTVAPAIAIRVFREKDHAVLTVQDNGPGIPANELNRVFEPFFTTKKIGEGTGLGLSVSYYIITTTHKGTMHVESPPGQGARFVISLPL